MNMRGHSFISVIAAVLRGHREALLNADLP